MKKIVYHYCGARTGTGVGSTRHDEAEDGNHAEMARKPGAGSAQLHAGKNTAYIPLPPPPARVLLHTPIYHQVQCNLECRNVSYNNSHKQ